MSTPQAQKNQDNTTEALRAVAQRYAVGITPHLEGLIDPTDLHDPIAAQFVPDVRELIDSAGESEDPTGDRLHTPVRGLVHRHPDRVLFTPHYGCLAYCRFCFRRARVGTGNEVLTDQEISAALAYIEAHPEIWEVILTGGDPLALSTTKLAALMERLHALRHVRVLRLHTRAPVMAPQRVTESLIRALRGGLKGEPSKPVFVVLHTNHVRELTPEVREACSRFVDAGMPMLSQSVLLRGVNDSPHALDSLMRTLVEMRIKPYYLHHLDKAPGVEHFRISHDDGKNLVHTLWNHASGLCQPRYVCETPNGQGKTPVW